jgi:hypothetical protein
MCVEGGKLMGEGAQYFLSTMATDTTNALPTRDVKMTELPSNKDLLGYMKLEEEKDPALLDSIKQWIEYITTTKRLVYGETKATCCALLLQRLLRAFYERNLQKANETGDASNGLPAQGTGAFSGQEAPIVKLKLSRKVVAKLVNVSSDLLEVLRVTKSTTSLVSITTVCLNLLDKNSNFKGAGILLWKLALKYCQPFLSNANQIELDSSKAEQTFAIFLTHALQTIRQQAITAVERRSDLDYLYQTCLAHAEFRQPVSQDTLGLNVVEQTSYAMACFMCHMQDQARSKLIARRCSILTMTASLVMILSLAELLAAPPTADDHEVPEENTPKAPLSPTSPNKRQKVEESTNNVPIGAHNDMVEIACNAANQLLHYLAWTVVPEDPDMSQITRMEIESDVAIICSILNSSPAMPLWREKAPTLSRQWHDSPTNRLLLGSIRNPRFLQSNYMPNLQALWKRQLSVLTISSSGGSDGSLPPIPVDIVPFWSPVATLEKDDYKHICSTTHIRPHGKKPGRQVAIVASKEVSVMKQMGSWASNEQVAAAPQTCEPTITETMEMNEWSVSVLNLSMIKPSENLLHYLEVTGDDSLHSNPLKDIIAPVLNQAVARIYQDISLPREDESEEAENWISVDPVDGQVYLHQDIKITPSIQLCASVIGFYYQALEAILHEESERLLLASHKTILQVEAFHRALLVCCYTCIWKAVANTRHLKVSPSHYDFTIYSLLETLESSPYTYLKVTESFHRALALQESKDQLVSPIVTKLPRILQRHIKRTEVQVLDSVIWARESPFSSTEGSLIKTIGMLKRLPNVWPPESLEPNLPEEMEDIEVDVGTVGIHRNSTHDTKFVSYIFRKLLQVSHVRIQVLCQALDIPSNYPVASQVWVALRYLLRHHVELLYDRHVDQFILCSVYGVTKIMKMKPEMTFARIIEVYVAIRGQELGERSCQRIVRHIKLIPVDNQGEVSVATKPFGNVMALYNQVFLPPMKTFLLHSKSLKRSAERVEAKMNNAEKRDASLERSVSSDRVGTTAERSSHVTVREGNCEVQMMLGPLNYSQESGKHMMSSSTPYYPPELTTFLHFGAAAPTSKTTKAI